MARMAAIVGLAAVVGLCACTTLLPSGPEACPDALLEGTLVRGDDGEMDVHNPEVDVDFPVSWPDGWTSREVGGVLQLFDGERAVGAEGDRFSAGGGFSPGPVEVFDPCGPIALSAGA